VQPLFGTIHRTCLSALVTDRAIKVVSFLHCMNDPQPEGHMASYIGRRKFLAMLGGAADRGTRAAAGDVVIAAAPVIICPTMFRR